MNESINSLPEVIPWLFPLLVNIVAGLIIFLLLALPSYYIFYPFLSRVSDRLNQLVQLLLKNYSTRRAIRKDGLNTAADDFLKDGGLYRIKAGHTGQWTGLKRRQVKVLKRLTRPVNATARSMKDLGKHVSGIHERIDNATIVNPPILPNLPEPKDVSSSVAALRIAWMRLVMTSIILLSLMVVNTGMLSQILMDLGVVPPGVHFIGLPLAYVFAFILTLVEAGLGLAHGATRSKNPEKISIMPIMISAFAVIVACVEGFFYSRVAPSTGTFTIPLFEYEIPQRHLFFFWGFVLVMTLFTLGMIAYDSLVTILRGTESGTLRREMKKLRIQHDRFAKSMNRAQTVLEQVKVVTVQADHMIHGPATNAESIHEEMSGVVDRMGALEVNAPEWTRVREGILTRSEVHHLAQSSGLWLILSLLGMFVITYTGLETVEIYFPNYSQPLLWLIALGQGLVFFGAGVLLGTGETVVSGKEGERKVWGGPRFTRWSGFLLVGILSITYLGAALLYPVPRGVGAILLLCLIVGLFLVTAAYQLSPVFNLIPLWLRRLWNIIILILETLWIAIVRLFQFIVVFFEYLAHLFATPFIRYFERRQPRENV